MGYVILSWLTEIWMRLCGFCEILYLITSCPASGGIDGSNWRFWTHPNCQWKGSRSAGETPGSVRSFRFSPSREHNNKTVVTMAANKYSITNHQMSHKRQILWDEDRAFPASECESIVKQINGADVTYYNMIRFVRNLSPGGVSSGGKRPT
jgi:hypothetical protein